MIRTRLRPIGGCRNPLLDEPVVLLDDVVQKWCRPAVTAAGLLITKDLIERDDPTQKLRANYSENAYDYNGRIVSMRLR